MYRVKSPQDFGAGLLFILIGAAGLVFGRDLAFGTGRSMGPGYFPTIISSLIVLIGVIIALKALVIEGPSIEPIRLRPVVFLLASVLVFALTIGVTGVIVSGLALLFLAAYARRDVNPLETLIFAVIVTAAVILLFVYALGQPLPIWWGT